MSCLRAGRKCCGGSIDAEGSSSSTESGWLLRMRQRLQRYLPIAMIALMVQILAPIGACWAAAVAASDPLHTAQICRDVASGNGQPSDQTGRHSQHGSACAICCFASFSPSINMPRIEALALPYRQTARIGWRDQALDPSTARAGSNAQARAPPSIS